MTAVRQMAQIEQINPPELGPARGFAHVTRANGRVWVAGQISCDATGRVLDPGNVVAQFARAVRNLRTALGAAGCSPQDVVKITYYVTDLPGYRRSLDAIGRAYREVFGHHYPASTLVGVRELFDPEAMVEIECEAVLP